MLKNKSGAIKECVVYLLHACRCTLRGERQRFTRRVNDVVL